MFNPSLVYAGFSILIPSVLAQDEVNDFCSRWDHQSIVKNNRLYIDGKVLFD